ncbi:MAG: N-acetyl-alpha-D-glucosaminyl L-malate synthase BshA, partial [Myxococcota bacterium]
MSAEDELPPTHLSIGIACYPTFGGSGIVATEIGLGMAKRGHRVHFISTEVPVRLAWHENVFFHAVSGATYPLMRHGDYALALASKLVDVATHEGLDVMHVHYAVPHATSAFLARQVLGESAPPVVTTLHGTDITLVGIDPSYLPITRHTIEQSQAVTTPSEFLKQATYDRLRLSKSVSIEVIENFVDTDRYRPPTVRDRTCFASLCPNRTGGANDPVLFHVS